MARVEKITRVLLRVKLDENESSLVQNEEKEFVVEKQKVTEEKQIATHWFTL